jgi:outer membrane protein, multidrug efflux system
VKKECVVSPALISGLLLTLALALAGCAQAPKKPEALPALPVPNQWPANISTGGVEAVKTHWRAFFPDPQLQALIEQALANNRDLRMAAARVEEARAQFGIARADQSPNAALSASGSLTRTPADLSDTGSASRSDRFDLGLTAISFELDFWNRIAGLSDAARASYLASEDARRAVHLSLVADVATAYFGYLQAVELEKLLRAVLFSRQQSLGLIEKGRDLGGAYDLDYQLALGLVEAAQAAVEGVEHQKNLTIHRMAFLVGTPTFTTPMARSMDEQGLEMALAPGLPSEVLLVRPDVMAAEKRLRAANSNIEAARAAFLPKVLLTAGMGLASQGLLGLFRGGSWSFQPSVTLPILDGGRLEAGADLAQARRVVAVADYEKTLQLAFREVSDLLSARETIGRQMRAAQANRRIQERLLLIAKARHDAGLASYLEVLEAERNLTAALQNIAQVRRAQLESATLLYKALGGGA